MKTNSASPEFMDTARPEKDQQDMASAVEEAAETSVLPGDEIINDSEKTREELEKYKSLIEEGMKALSQRDEIQEKYLRLAAEYDNYRKRNAKERESLYLDAKVEVVAKFLPVYDNLERALLQYTEDSAYQKGVELIMKQFCETLEKLGVSVMDTESAVFDPNLHDAVMHVEDENLGENEIAEVLQKGFMMGDKVIRHAIVKVAN